MKGLTTMLAVAALLATGGAAMGITYSDVIPPTTTNWTTPGAPPDPINIPQFDQSGGDTLTSVKLTLEGRLISDQRFESLDAAPATITLDLGALIDVQGLGGTLLSVTPSASISESVTAFDGSIDFSGTSGRTLPQTDVSDSVMTTYTNAADLAMFIGTGDVDFTVMAEGVSTGSGAGNLVTQFATQAGATVTVEYTSRPPDQPGVPEPATAMSSVLAAAALGLVLRRRRNRA